MATRPTPNMKKRRPIRKTSAVTVVKNGVRKARSIRKFADQYYIGMAYVGLMELDLKDSGTERLSNYEDDYRVYKGMLEKKTPFGMVSVSAYMKARVRTFYEGYGRDLADDYERYSNRERLDEYNSEYVPENRSLWAENMEGMSRAICYFHISYGIQDYKGEYRELYEKGGDNYPSVEDCLDAMTSASEEAWGDVTIALNEYDEEIALYNSQAEAFPDNIDVSLPDGGTLTLGKNRDRDGRWVGAYTYKDESKIGCTLIAKVYAVVLEDNGHYSDYHYMNYNERYYGVDRSKNVEYYGVEVTGEIFDENTQVSRVISDGTKFDEWKREFTGEGAETLEGAVAIIESNFAEVYQEFQDYIASVREYETRGHGLGYRRTTENVNDWNYNFGDTREDLNYEGYQDDPLYDEHDLYGERAEYYTGWNVYEDKHSFVVEYVGNDTWLSRALNVATDGGYWVITPDHYFGEEIERIMATKTRENVENACAMVGARLVEYTDPAHFIIEPTNRVAMSARKARKGMRKSVPTHIHYDVELAKMKALRGVRKSSKSSEKSFNSMVKSIKNKNKKKRAI